MWVKICGIRDEQTADQVCLMGASAIGLNFYAKSPRVVARDAAVRISRVAEDRVERVGVFVNHSAAEISDLVAECPLDSIQLHGDESPEQMARIAEATHGIRMYCAWRMAGESLVDLANHLAGLQAAGVSLAGCLVDSHRTGAYGGTGRTVSWAALAHEFQYDLWPALVLAGGLTPDNIADAARIVQPWGVDVASGVESTPGVKDLSLVKRFVNNARSICSDHGVHPKYGKSER